MYKHELELLIEQTQQELQWAIENNDSAYAKLMRSSLIRYSMISAN